MQIDSRYAFLIREIYSCDSFGVLGMFEMKRVEKIVMVLVA